jgi:hypothetical protein
MWQEHPRGCLNITLMPLLTLGCAISISYLTDNLQPVEGVSYLVIVGIVAWSAYTKATTGSGLPAGPSGLLGAAEGLSYLALVAGTCQLSC